MDKIDKMGEMDKIEDGLQEVPIRRKKGIIKKVYDFFSKPIPLMVLNGILIAIMVFLQLYFSGFLQPDTLGNCRYCHLLYKHNPISNP